MILSRFSRRDGECQGYAYSLAPSFCEPIVWFARSLYPSKKEPYPGAIAAKDWVETGTWLILEPCRTVREAMALAGVS